jgi:hypothetical protein
VSPEAAESAILLIAAGWNLHLYRHRMAGRVPLFAALYLVFPAIALAMQAAGYDVSAAPAKWAAVTVAGVLTAAMIASTRRADSLAVRALVDAERERRRLELRARAHALAEVVLSSDAAA